MAVTRLEHNTQYTTRSYWLTRIFLAFLKLPKLSEPFPHDASTSIPADLSTKHNVTIERLPADALPSDMVDRDKWSPFMLKRNKRKDVKRTVVYYHGGGFVDRESQFHWVLAARLSDELKADVVMQTYIMVPHAGIHENISNLAACFELVYDIAKADGHEVITGGESAGGNITAALLLYLKDHSMPLPDQAFMISPCLDLDTERPEEVAQVSNFPLTKVELILTPFKAWATGPIDKARLYKPSEKATPEEAKAIKHPYASPMNGDWSFAAEMKLPLTLQIGTADILSLQSERFAEICEQENVDLTIISAPNAGHVYPIFFAAPAASYLFPDAEPGLVLLIDTLKRNSEKIK